MRHHCLSSTPFVVALIMLLQISCQHEVRKPGIGQKQPAALKQGPKISFREVVHEFSDLVARTPYTCEFKFTNTGDSTLKITGLKRCCGVVVKVDRNEFAPGESGVVTASFVSGPDTSTMRRVIYVSSNDKENPEIGLTLRAVIKPKVDWKPKRLSLVLNEANSGCSNITITSLDGQPFSVKSFQSTGESITADVDPSVEATEFVLQPKVDLAKLELYPTGFVSIGLTHPNCDKVNVYFSTLLRFQLKPPSIVVFNAQEQKRVLKSVYLVSNYGEDFEIESISSEKGIAKVLSQEAITHGYSLDVEMTPPPRDGADQFTDVLTIQLKGGEKLTIECNGRYMEK